MRTVTVPQYPKEIEGRLSEKGRRRQWELVRVEEQGMARYRAVEGGQTALVTPEGWSYGLANGHITIPEGGATA